MTTINNGTCKLSRDNHVVTVEVVCNNAAEADALFQGLMRTIREEKRLELTFSGLTSELRQGNRMQ